MKTSTVLASLVLAALQIPLVSDSASSQARDDKITFIMKYTYARRCNELGRSADQANCIIEMMATRGAAFRDRIAPHPDSAVDELYDEYIASPWPPGTGTPTLTQGKTAPSIAEIDAAARKAAAGDAAKERDMRAALCAFYQAC